MVTVFEPVSLQREAASGGALRKRRSPLGDAARTLGRNPVALGGLLVILTWLALGALAPVLPLEDPETVLIERKLQAPSWEHPFGTDDVGRDLVSRVIYASRVSVPAGLLIVAVTMTIGSVLGAIAGYFGGIVDGLIMRICDAVL